MAGFVAGKAYERVSSNKRELVDLRMMVNRLTQELADEAKQRDFIDRLFDDDKPDEIAGGDTFTSPPCVVTAPPPQPYTGSVDWGNSTFQTPNELERRLDNNTTGDISSWSGEYERPVSAEWHSKNIDKVIKRIMGDFNNDQQVP